MEYEKLRTVTENYIKLIEDILKDENYFVSIRLIPKSKEDYDKGLPDALKETPFGSLRLEDGIEYVGSYKLT